MAPPPRPQELASESKGAVKGGGDSGKGKGVQGKGADGGKGKGKAEAEAEAPFLKGDAKCKGKGTGNGTGMLDQGKGKSQGKGKVEVATGKGKGKGKEREDCLVGEWRTPHNDLQDQKVGGGHKAIHDEATANKVGFSAAPIHGTVHWSQFTPLLLEAFGPAWFETGSISVHFVTPVSHLQRVRAFMARPDPSKKAQQVSIWMEHEDGRVVLEGTASVGLRPDQMKSMVTKKIAAIKPSQGALLFVRHPAGTKTTNVETARIDFDKEVGPLFPFTLRQKLGIITEPHPWFTEAEGASSPWGRPVLPPECLNQIMLGLCGAAEPPRWPPRPEDRWLAEAAGGRTPVGLFGGCEAVMHSGPVFPGVTYEVTRELVGKGETPRAEFRWVRTLLREPGAGRLVAEMTLQEMMLKASFDGYAELRARSDGLAAASAKL